MKSPLTGKKILITGAGSGLGRLCALDMATKGAELILWDINPKGLKQVRDEIISLGAKANSFICDVSDKKMVRETAKRTKKATGIVDILVNNAGVVTGKTLLDCSDSEIEATINVNLLSHFWTIREFLPDMLKQGSGQIISISSAAGIIGVNRLADYSASKFGVFGLDESLRAELRVKGAKKIRTTVVCPFFINTGMFAGVRTRVPFLLPILDEKKVAKQIVRAIETKKRRLIIPPVVSTIWLLRLLSVGFFDAVIDFLGVNSTMKNYRGRGGR